MNVDLYKYKSKNPLIRWMVNNYFNNVSKLYAQIESDTCSVAELGCGEGFSTLRLLKLLDSSKKFHAFDNCKESVCKARQLLPASDFGNKSIQEVCDAGYNYDLIFLLQVLEHLKEPEHNIRLIRKISDKYLILGVPNEPLWRFCNMLRLKYLWQLGNTPGHINHWNSKSLVKLIKENFGPVICCIKSFPWVLLLAKKDI